MHVHNEESGALAAAAEAQLTGRLAVCAGSCGPGNTHLIQGVFNAHQSGAPVLVLASHIPTSETGTGFFQETHPEQLFAQASHWCEVLSAPAQVSRLVRIAIQHAVGRRGAAVLVLPGETGDIPLSDPTKLSYGPVAPALVQPPDEAVQLLADRLDAAETVTIFGGIGCEEVLALAGALNAPVRHSLRGKEVLQYDNPFDEEPRVWTATQPAARTRAVGRPPGLRLGSAGPVQQAQPVAAHEQQLQAVVSGL